ncbi:MAG: ARMT1-like domain-containing protein [Kiritimatiellia bacterium]
MKTALDCIPCFVRQASEAVGYCVPDEHHREHIMRCLLSEIAGEEWHASPAEVAQRLHRLIRRETGNPDPYRPLKDRMNRLALEMFPAFRQQALSEEDPQMAIARMALAGNLIDAGAKTGLTEKDVRTALCRACREPVDGSARNLFQAAERARQILFLADNAGELVFDRALIEALPREKMVVAVRGSPVINDATMEDAETAGLPEIVPVISNGSDAPGTVVEDCSDRFRQLFETSDLIIAKGQGNFETLSATPKHIFFLLRVKCPRVAADIGAPVGSMVICERNSGRLGADGRAVLEAPPA